MRKDVSKRINSILNSTQGSHRAKPKTDLLTIIEREIYEIEGNLIPIKGLKLAAAAAVIMLMLNISVLNHYFQNSGEVDLVEMEHSTALITDFKLYD